MRYFVVSDIHSFYKPLKKALREKHFFKKDSSHALIVCGDIFDRGPDTIKVYKFLKTIPKKRCILIKGNHEELYFRLLQKDYPEDYDFSNGTVRTFCHIAAYELSSAEMDPDNTERELWYLAGSVMFSEKFPEEAARAKATWKNIVDAVKHSEITKWLKSDQWVNYYELYNYIFVHSFIPLLWNQERGLSEDYCIYYGYTQYFDYKFNWRDSSNKEWAKAAWGCAYKFFDAGLFDEEKKNGKVLVCGHYRCSEFNKHYYNIESHDIYYGKNLIAIDATTALTDTVNVLVIDYL